MPKSGISDAARDSVEDDNSSPEESSELPTEFVGKWVGIYADVADELIIQKGDGNELNIILHVNFMNPAQVTGQMIDTDTVDIPQQTISGMPGTAELTLDGEHLVLRQSGMGLTFEGKYTRAK